MIRHHLKVALRNLVRNRGTTLINVTGMAVGMACAVLIFFWVSHQLGYDKDQIHRDRIYRLESSWVDDEIFEVFNFDFREGKPGFSPFLRRSAPDGSCRRTSSPGRPPIWRSGPG